MTLNCFHFITQKMFEEIHKHSLEILLNLKNIQ